GTPEEFKSLVDAAHGMGIAVVIDLIHSHSVKNELDGLSRFDGSLWQYFHEGSRGDHPAWDSRCFDYGKPAVLHFLLSNCRYWTEEFHLDGFRFDGVTSMLYFDHGLGKVFTSYADYFHPGVDEEALVYLSLANELIHDVRPGAITIAEDVSGMPGLVSPAAEGGSGFDYRLAMGVPDLWAKLGSAGVRDEDWNVEHIYSELTNRRAEEKVISYVESHDQAIVGGKSFIFRLLESSIYHDMGIGVSNPHVDRGIALWKMARLLTLATAPHGYLNFIGNEFGHPEWVDFPRQGNQWSGHYARRQWSLRDNPELKYHALGDFDAAILDLLGTREVFSQPTRLHETHVGHQVLIFQRDGFLIAANFHPWNSLVDYPIHAPAGVWELALDTDETRFAGPSRIRPKQRYHARPVNGGHEIMLYLPARSALVLREVTG
ncbi:MAG: 1,4-alpha-glucan-branching enzyme, partial [Verrucomicrobiaceae bacterium]